MSFESILLFGVVPRRIIHLRFRNILNFEHTCGINFKFNVSVLIVFFLSLGGLKKWFKLRPQRNTTNSAENRHGRGWVKCVWLAWCTADRRCSTLRLQRYYAALSPGRRTQKPGRKKVEGARLQYLVHQWLLHRPLSNCCTPPLLIYTSVVCLFWGFMCACDCVTINI